MNTWIISPNWLAWTFFIIASVSLAAIAIRMWITPRHTKTLCTSSNAHNGSFVIGELYKTSILTAWLAFSMWLMWKVYNNPILSGFADFWSNLIAIIAIIVATLIGWQIYSAMDWNSKAAKLDRIEKVENKLNIANQKLEEQDARNLLLIRAVNEIRKVTTHDDVSLKYRCAAKAISLLLDANVPIKDDLIEVQTEILSSLLEAMEKSGDMQSRRYFAQFLQNMDNIYNQIISSINKREGDLSEFRSLIIAIRDRRKKFVENNL